MFKTLREDIRTVFAEDPAARNILEVVFLYPGLHALWFHRLAHWLWEHRLRFFARSLSHYARFLTGVEIHPGAKIGRRFFIDHGMGVVIGETAEIGNDVLIYQGVVLGGTTLQKKKRHPTIGNSVVIGSAAILLGPITVGDGARIGANSVVVGSVPPGAIVVGVPGRVVEDRQRTAAMPLEHNKMPDPFSEAIRLILKEQVRLSERLGRLEGLKDVAAASDELTKKIIEIEKAFENKDENNKGET